MTESHAPAAGSDPELHLRDILNFLRRNRWTIVGIAAVVVASVGYYTWTRQPIYEATATIHVDEMRSVLPELAFLEQVVRGAEVETEMALLRSRSIAEETVDTLNLHVRLVRPQGVRRSQLFSDLDALRSATPNTYRFTLEGERYRATDRGGRLLGTYAIGEAAAFDGLHLVLFPTLEQFPDEIILRIADFNEAVQELLDHMNVFLPYRDASVIGVTYWGTDPEVVKQVPNTLARAFIDSRQEAKKTEARSTVEFLNQQIAMISEQLRTAEEDLVAFQEGQQVVNLEAEGAQQIRRLVDLQAERDILESEYTSLSKLLADVQREARDSRSDGPSPYRQLAAFPTFLKNQAVTELLRALTEVETERTQQASRRTPLYPEVEALDNRIRQLENQLYQLAVNYQESLRKQSESLNERLRAFGTQLERIPVKEVQLARLERQRKVLEEVFTLLQTRLKEAEIAQAVEPGDVRIVDPAILPREPIRPRKARSLILAVIFGFTLGVGLAAARDYLDETVHTREDLIEVTELPVLGLIPRIRPGSASADGRRARRLVGAREERPLADRLITQVDVGNPVSEAYRAFRTNITFLDLDRPPRVLLFTSPAPSEGKSTSAANLAITLAQQKTRTLLIDCDLRRGILHRVFAVPKEPGLTNVLLSSTALSEATHTADVGGGATLHFMGTGTLPPNPSELLGSRRMRELLDELRQLYEAILLDSPPLNLVTDAAVLGAAADGVILIARAGTTERGALRYAREQLEAVRAPVSGVVLNDVDFSGRGRYYGSGSGYRYYYRYYRSD
ncbi:MAG: polysaccharide biosynthesis tyrosine autokinase [Gemmatimonadetes bacterium]|nr:polysaccharide biosynthesis tyrosine autokinase [Gemmatimonadota bacterium]